MIDYIHYCIEHDGYYKKALAYLEAAQCLSPTATAVALVNAECKLLEAIASLRGALAAIRERQVHAGAF